MSESLIRARWIAGRFEPLGRSSQLWCQRMSDREVLILDVIRERSERGHRHQFAEITEAWRNLPESLQGMPWAVNPDTLRKHLLIVCGFADVRTVVAGSKAEAGRIAALLTQLATEAHGYAITDLRDNVVTLRTPHSQSYRAMGRDRFQESKAAILDAAAELLGVDVADLAQTAA